MQDGKPEILRIEIVPLPPDRCTEHRILFLVETDRPDPLLEKASTIYRQDLVWPTPQHRNGNALEAIRKIEGNIRTIRKQMELHASECESR